MDSFTITISEHTDEEIGNSISLMKNSFGDTDVATRQYYDWQYLQNPAGRGTVMIAYDGEKAAGQFACIPCIYRFHGKPLIVPLTLNLCVHPDYRGKGLMGILIGKMQEHLKNRAFTFSIGLPNFASLHGHLKNGYEGLPLTVSVKPIRPSFYFRHKIIQAIIKPTDLLWKKKITNATKVLKMVDPYDSRFDNLDDKWNKGKILVQSRSSRYLNWRYYNNPTRRYETLLHPDSANSVRGYTVIRVTDVKGLKVVFIMELVAFTIDIARDLVDEIIRRSWNENVPFLVAASFPDNAELNNMGKLGFFKCPSRLRPHPFLLCIRSLDNSILDRNTLFNPASWFFSIGDNDAI